MAVVGARLAVDLLLQTGLDGTRILQFAMRNGKSAQEVIAEAAAIIGTVNDRLAARFGGITYLTNLDHAIYRQGSAGRRMTPKKVETKMADPIRGDTVGGMLPLNDYEDAVGWSKLYLRDAWDAQIDADLNEVGDSWENRVDYEVLVRMFSTTENAIGSGYDVPWAIGTGVNVPFIPVQNGSYNFDDTHSHFTSIDGAVTAANLTLALEAAIVQIRHHKGMGGRLIAFVAETDLALYTAIAGKKFATMIPPGFTVVAGNTNAPTVTVSGELEGMPGELFGYFLSDRGLVELRYHPRIPTGFGWVGKSFGVNNQLNPLAIREHPTVGFGLTVDPQVTSSVMPELDYVLFKATHGIGVNNRLAGVAFQVGTGAATYTAPTIPA